MTRHVTFPTFPKSCHLEISKASPYVLTGGSAGRIERMAEYLDHPESVEFVEGDRKLTVVYGDYQGLPIMAATTGMGPSSVDITIPEIIEASSDPNLVILRLGTCGATKSYVNVGDLIISKDRIYRHEDVSTWITLNPFYVAVPDADIVEVLKTSAENNKLDFQHVFSGKTTTVSELYFTNIIYEHLLGKPITKKLLYLFEDTLSLSMEGSVYCALRDTFNHRFGYKIRMGELLAVSDVVVPGAVKVGDRERYAEKIGQIEKGQILTGLETLLALSKK